ncbi:hypothetical protein EGM97_18435 [Pseudomonas sp. AF32]|uniref:hypothetical protein n=1 Tax=Pseudomonas sp. AF32 TaxID=554390 RepID=UPI001EED3C2E|nr:hypothetical protein [Pseudomonas sp. AF32]MCG6576675.1 hypothetical protein [Pseudomonas sp. AF32]
MDRLYQHATTHTKNQTHSDFFQSGSFGVSEKLINDTSNAHFSSELSAQASLATAERSRRVLASIL